ncbi:hypothetical protein BGZ74_008039 [Mortierella antarctica]|nr:hypothetical protein BGZ74_008039 [Mortierella antarctica]
MYHPHYQHHSQLPHQQQHAGLATPAVTSPPSPSSSSPSIIALKQQQQLLQHQQFAKEFWEEQLVAVEESEPDFKNHPLPLARIKKVMKSDPEVKMISAEAPILFSKACEIFICEITRRAWLHAEENKRRTLQRSDVANAVSKSDQFDFLIDIIPREESQAAAAASAANNASASASASGVPAGSIPAPPSSSSQPVGGVVVGKDGKPVAYENQYAHYFPQGGMAGYQHVLDPQYYQPVPVSQEQLQQYIQYQQQQVVYQAQAQAQAQAQGQEQQKPAKGARRPSSRKK